MSCSIFMHRVHCRRRGAAFRALCVSKATELRDSRGQFAVVGFQVGGFSLAFSDHKPAATGRDSTNEPTNMSVTDESEP